MGKGEGLEAGVVCVPRPVKPDRAAAAAGLGGPVAGGAAAGQVAGYVLLAGCGGVGDDDFDGAGVCGPGGGAGFCVRVVLQDLWLPGPRRASGAQGLGAYPSAKEVLWRRYRVDGERGGRGVVRQIRVVYSPFQAVSGVERAPETAALLPNHSR